MDSSGWVEKPPLSGAVSRLPRARARSGGITLRKHLLKRQRGADVDAALSGEDDQVIGCHADAQYFAQRVIIMARKAGLPRSAGRQCEAMEGGGTEEHLAVHGR